MDQFQLRTERYEIQKEIWPQSGRHVLAQYNDQGILVYQAYNNEIADYALENQKFGGSWSTTRMSWIKTSFLWMMFRSGWGTKKNQERVLGIWLKRERFESYIALAAKESDEKGTIRCQWDPDHYPDGERHPYRKAIQLGLRNVQSFITGDDILRIIDVTPLVNEQYQHILSKNYTELVTPQETAYPLRTSDGNAIEETETSIRVTLMYKNKQKVVVLREGSEGEVMDMIYQKFKVKGKSVILPSGKYLSKRIPKDLPQGSTLIVS
eukprot:TRINITY_DN5064_c0_g1_i2.p1 TRINITY_DN5064_c0_g1~~TRINITY_DN5064_c0_g1_i2.p1  ORF type:complete len:275 (-),score=17.57 TRINITY_DN5064_c0_g1_i2:614-1411(-)